MSDRELISLDARQFAVLEALLSHLADVLEGKLAHVERTLHSGLEAIAQGGSSGDISAVLTAINNLIGKVGLVRTAVDGLSTTIAELKTTVADLQAQIAQGQLDQSRLDAAAASLEKADDDLDGIVLPGTMPTDEPPAQG